MLIELRIRNFAVIEDLLVKPGPGLTVLTGETGAGKSIIVDALALLLGERASADAVRTGAERAVIEGVFDIADRPELRAVLVEQGVDTEDDLVVLRREVAAEGRNRAWVNGSATTAALVGELGRRLVDLHGQHEHQTLMRSDEQRAILDARAGATALAERVAEAHEALREATRRIEELDRRRAEIEARAEFLRFQAGEIERLNLVDGEEESLEADGARLDHAEDLARLSENLYQSLYAAGDAVTARLDELRRTIDQLIRLDASQADARAQIDEAFYTLDELGRRMGDYASSVEHDPSRLDDIRRRQDAIFRLKAKYGPELSDVIAAGARAREELDLLDRATFERREAEKAVEKAEAEHTRAASSLTKSRKKGAKELVADVSSLLPDLGMPAARFDVVLTPVDPPRANGAEEVEFHIAVNAGFEPRPLARVASGGELSRIMLALKASLASYDAVPTLVFDEVDVGIGGRAAHGVAAKLHEVAGAHQVFVVTHLPQIASRADQHLFVEKAERAGTTVTTLQVLQGDDRVRELARLLGGDPESAVSLEHAREMLGAAAG